MFNFIKIRNFNFLKKNSHTPTNIILIPTKKQNGITLIALIITIVILLILAGVVLNLTLGEKGIFNIAKNASKNFMDAQNKELSDLEKLYSELKIATNIDSQITINVEDLNKIIDDKVNEKVQEQISKGASGITENSLLMQFENTNTSINTFNLTSFSSTFSDNSSNYLEYDKNTGNITCKEDGWYLIEAYTWISVSPSCDYSQVYLKCYLNGNVFGLTDTLASAGFWTSRDRNSITVYLKKDDLLSFSQNNVHYPLTAGNTSILLYKL